MTTKENNLPLNIRIEHGLIKSTQELYETIAKEILGIKTLETRNSDSLDFYEVSVWGVTQALKIAYLAGVEAAFRGDVFEVKPASGKTEPVSSQSLWNRYWEYECEICKYVLGKDTERILGIIDTDLVIDADERASILRLMGFDPESDAVWIGVSKQTINILSDSFYSGSVFAGESREPHSRFAVINGCRRKP
ncbi:MAG: DUF6900 domain-containing protein [Thermoguttaceae bacterium]